MHRLFEDTRGATFVEYALIVALVAFVGMVGVNGARAALGGVLGDVKSSIEVGQGGVEVAAAPTTSTSVVTVPTTTTPPTTAPPTTAAPTTAAPSGPTSAGGSFSTATTSTNGLFWTAQATLTVKGNNGQALAGATVSVQVRYLQKDWFGNATWQTTVVQVQTDAQGKATVSGGPYFEGNGAFSVSQVTLTVQGITTSNGVAWDGAAASASANQP